MGAHRIYGSTVPYLPPQRPLRQGVQRLMIEWFSVVTALTLAADVLATAYQLAS